MLMFAFGSCILGKGRTTSLSGGHNTLMVLAIRSAPPIAITSSTRAIGRSFPPIAFTSRTRNSCPPRVPTPPPTTPANSPPIRDGPAAPKAAPHNPPVTRRAAKLAGALRLGVFGSLSATNSTTAPARSTGIACAQKPETQARCFQGAATQDAPPS
jgi:hypothetical protein